MMTGHETYVSELLSNAQAAARSLAVVSTADKNAALLKAAEEIAARASALQAANARDIEAAEAAGISTAMVDRLRLTDQRIEDMAEGLRDGLADDLNANTETRRFQ